MFNKKQQIPQKTEALKIVIEIADENGRTLIQAIDSVTKAIYAVVSQLDDMTLDREYDD